MVGCGRFGLTAQGCVWAAAPARAGASGRLRCVELGQVSTVMSTRGEPPTQTCAHAPTVGVLCGGLFSPDTAASASAPGRCRPKCVPAGARTKRARRHGETIRAQREEEGDAEEGRGDEAAAEDEHGGEEEGRRERSAGSRNRTVWASRARDEDDEEAGEQEVDKEDAQVHSVVLRGRREDTHTVSRCRMAMSCPRAASRTAWSKACLSASPLSSGGPCLRVQCRR